MHKTETKTQHETTRHKQLPERVRMIESGRAWGGSTTPSHNKDSIENRAAHLKTLGAIAIDCIR